MGVIIVADKETAEKLIGKGFKYNTTNSEGKVYYEFYATDELMKFVRKDHLFTKFCSRKTVNF